MISNWVGELSGPFPIVNWWNGDVIVSVWILCKMVLFLLSQVCILMFFLNIQERGRLSGFVLCQPHCWTAALLSVLQLFTAYFTFGQSFEEKRWQILVNIFWCTQNYVRFLLKLIYISYKLSLKGWKHLLGWVNTYLHLEFGDRFIKSFQRIFYVKLEGRILH